MQKGLFSSRRADMDLTMQVFLMDLVIMVALLGVMMHEVSGLDDNTIAQKEYLARDLSLLLNTLYAAPMDVDNLVYSPDDIDLSRFRIDIGDGRVAVEDTDTQGGTIYYPFAKNKYMQSDVQTSLHATHSIVLGNTNGVVSVGENSGINQAASSTGLCTGVDKSGSFTGTIIFNPMPMDPLSPEASFEGSAHDEYTLWDMAQQLKDHGFRRMEDKPKLQVTPKEPGDEVKLEGTPSLIVSLTPSVADEQTAPVTIRYLGSDTGRAIACSVKSSFENSEQISSDLNDRMLQVSVERIREKSLPSGHPVHKTEDVATVMVSFGNVALEEEAMYNKASGDVLRRIEKGIRGYYE